MVDDSDLNSLLLVFSVAGCLVVRDLGADPPQTAFSTANDYQPTTAFSYWALPANGSSAIFLACLMAFDKRR